MRHGEVAMPEAAPLQRGDGWRPDAVLALSEDVEIERYDLPKRSYAVFNRRSGLEMEVDGSYEPLLELLNGRHSAQEIVVRFADGDRGPSGGSIADFARRATKKAASDLLKSLIHEGFVSACAGGSPVHVRTAFAFDTVDAASAVVAPLSSGT
jgi:hypothetical protein